MKEERGVLEKETEARHRRRKGLGLENKCAVASEEVPSECGDTGFVEVLMGLYPHEVSTPGFGSRESDEEHALKKTMPSFRFFCSSLLKRITLS